MKKTATFLLAFVLILGLAGGAQALMIFEDTFDVENGGVGALNYTGFANWTVSDGTVDLIGNGYFDFLPGNGLYVDMDGSTRNAGKMTTSFDLDPGSYQLSFELAGNRRNGVPERVDVQVAMGSIFSKSYTLRRFDPFTLFEEDFAIIDPMEISLSFEGIGGDNIGMLLDDVRLFKAEAVPEPTTMVLLGIGMVGLAGVSRKKGFRK